MDSIEITEENVTGVLRANAILSALGQGQVLAIKGHEKMSSSNLLNMLEKAGIDSVKTLNDVNRAILSARKDMEGFKWVNSKIARLTDPAFFDVYGDHYRYLSKSMSDQDKAAVMLVGVQKPVMVNANDVAVKAFLDGLNKTEVAIEDVALLEVSSKLGLNFDAFSNSPESFKAQAADAIDSLEVILSVKGINLADLVAMDPIKSRVEQFLADPAMAKTSSLTREVGHGLYDFLEKDDPEQMKRIVEGMLVKRLSREDDIANNLQLLATAMKSINLIVNGTPEPRPNIPEITRALESLALKNDRHFHLLTDKLKAFANSRLEEGEKTVFFKYIEIVGATISRINDLNQGAQPAMTQTELATKTLYSDAIHNLAPTTDHDLFARSFEAVVIDGFQMNGIQDTKGPNPLLFGEAKGVVYPQGLERVVFDHQIQDLIADSLTALRQEGGRLQAH